MLWLIFAACLGLGPVQAVDFGPEVEQYSHQWISILENLHSSFRINFNSFGERLDSVFKDSNVSTDCQDSLRVYFGEPLSKQWTVQSMTFGFCVDYFEIFYLVWDSNGHFPSGLLTGTFFEPGNYDQCLDIQHENINGKYCLLEFKVPNPVYKVTLNGTKWNDMENAVNFITRFENFSRIANGICLPSTCSDKELEVIIPRGAET